MIARQELLHKRNELRIYPSCPPVPNTIFPLLQASETHNNSQSSLYPCLRISISPLHSLVVSTSTSTPFPLPFCRCQGQRRSHSLFHSHSSLHTNSTLFLLTISPLSLPFRPLPFSLHSTKQLRLKNKLPLLIFLRLLKRFIVLPPHGILAIPALDVSHNMSSRRHVTLGCFFLNHVYHIAKKVGFAMLAAEMLWR